MVERPMCVPIYLCQISERCYLYSASTNRRTDIVRSTPYINRSQNIYKCWGQTEKPFSWFREQQKWQKYFGCKCGWGTCITIQEGQILTALGNLNELQGLSSVFLKGTYVTEELEDHHLGLDEEAGIIMIPAPSKTTNEGLADRSNVESQKGMRLAHTEGNTKLIRQDALVLSINSSLNLKKYWTKGYKAKHCARFFLYFIQKMVKKELTVPLVLSWGNPFPKCWLGAPYKD